MGAIQWKRGSARQAPPDVYLPFFSVPENSETDQAFRATGWIIVTITAMFFILGIVAILLEHLGLWKPGGS